MHLATWTVRSGQLPATGHRQAAPGVTDRAAVGCLDAAVPTTIAGSINIDIARLYQTASAIGVHRVEADSGGRGYRQRRAAQLHVATVDGGYGTAIAGHVDPAAVDECMTARAVDGQCEVAPGMVQDVLLTDLEAVAVAHLHGPGKIGGMGRQCRPQ
ncbi:MAG: hypothetical protein ACN6OU_08675 [Stenotrophomonas acidaminiphila]